MHHGVVYADQRLLALPPALNRLLARLRQELELNVLHLIRLEEVG